mgnify:CR=1 FL=1
MTDNSKIEVSVSMHCSRKKKDYAVRLPLAEAQTFIDQQEFKTRTAASVKKGFEDLGAGAPDLVISYRGQTFILPTVHTKNDDGIHRLINDLLQERVFELKEPKTRGPREAAAAPDAPTKE